MTAAEPQPRTRLACDLPAAVKDLLTMAYQVRPVL